MVSKEKCSGLKKFVAENMVFLVLYFLFLVVGAYLILTLEKGDEILYINNLHNSFGNEFFKWTSRLAEAPAFSLIFLFMLFSSYGKGLLLGINLGLVSGAVQFLKLVVFDDSVRPAAFFQGKAQLNFIEGVQMFTQNSHPSGHTAIGFAVCFMLCLFTSNKYLKALYFFVALLIGVSRVYLLQHFFRDVYVGSLLAMGITTIFWLTFGQSSFYQNLKWKDKAVLK